MTVCAISIFEDLAKNGTVATDDVYHSYWGVMTACLGKTGADKMTDKNISRGKITIRSAIAVLLLLVGLLQLSFWADIKSFEVEGPSRMVRGPQDTIYIQIDRKIAKVSSDGEALHVLDLDREASIPEHIADFFVEDDGRLLIARRDSQLLQYYSPEGKLMRFWISIERSGEIQKG